MVIQLKQVIVLTAIALVEKVLVKGDLTVEGNDIHSSSGHANYFVWYKGYS